jgi:hypothetical protein
MIRTLVITPCSAKKRSDCLGSDERVPEPALAADLADPERRQQASARLADHALPAAEMYAGTHHRLVMEGVEAVWQRWGREVLDLAILSGGYGILRADEPIIPYDVTFDQFEGDALADWGARLQVPAKAAALAGQYDLVFLLLDGSYLAVLSLPLDVPDSVQQLILTDQDSLDLVPARANVYPLVAAEAVAARRWHVKAPHVRGFLFRRICAQVVQHGPGLLEWLYQHPEDTELLFYKSPPWRPQLAFWPGTGKGSP